MIKCERNSLEGFDDLENGSYTNVFDFGITSVLFRIIEEWLSVTMFVVQMPAHISS